MSKTETKTNASILDDPQVQRMVNAHKRGVALFEILKLEITDPDELMSAVSGVYGSYKRHMAKLEQQT